MNQEREESSSEAEEEPLLSSIVVQTPPVTPSGRPGCALERPSPLNTSSSKKMAISKTPVRPAGESSSQVPLQGYRLINCQEYMQELSEHSECPSCHSRLTLEESLSGRRGLVSKMKTVCANKDCSYEMVMSDPYKNSAKSLN